jgi:5-methylthioadenosine/S-adenosylhomocysteine deaminase
MVDGRIVAEDGVLKAANLKDILAEVQRVAPALFARRAAYLAGTAEGSPQWTQKSRV